MGTPPPRLGEHSAEVLAGFGYAPAEVAALRAAGVLGPVRGSAG